MRATPPKMGWRWSDYRHLRNAGWPALYPAQLPTRHLISLRSRRTRRQTADQRDRRVHWRRGRLDALRTLALDAVPCQELLEPYSLLEARCRRGAHGGPVEECEATEGDSSVEPGCHRVCGGIPGPSGADPAVLPAAGVGSQTLKERVRHPVFRSPSPHQGAMVRRRLRGALAGQAPGGLRPEGPPGPSAFGGLG